MKKFDAEKLIFIQLEMNIHFNALLFSTHKAVITLWGEGRVGGGLVSAKHC